MAELPKVSQQLSNPISENLQKLAALFPAAVKDGELDIEALRNELGDFAEIQPGDEKFELNWAGKQAAKKEAFKPLLAKTLKYVEEDSKNPDTTENIYIEGDNLEALKLLRQNYYGAIKMIYIDPPYNTGKDFVYKDNFKVSAKESDEAEGVRSESGERLIKNEKSSNRFHANWLDMMYPRLKLGKDLLREDGVIFVSIDGNEVSNLRKMCDEIFGEENFVDCVVWDKKSSAKGVPPRNMMVNVHEYIVAYQKSDAFGFLGEKRDESKDGFKNLDNDPRGPWRESNIKSTTKPIEEAFTITDPNTGRDYTNTWAFSKDSLEKMISEGRILWKETLPKQKEFMHEMTNENKAIKSSWGIFDPQSTTVGLKKLIPEVHFENPKPLNLINYLLNVSLEKDAVIIDFFAGSGTTAHAVMKLNSEDNGNRKYIMVQLQEACNEKSEAAKAGYKTIAEIGKERIRRAGEKIKAELVEKHQALLNADGELELDDQAPETNPYILNPDSLDIGFKCFRIEDTKINWLKQDLSGGELVDADISSKDKLDFVPGFTDLDVVYEIMLRQSSIPLTQRITTLTDIGKRTYLYGDSYLICLEEDITKEMVEKLAKLEPTPLKFIFRDSAFGKDIAFKDETFRRLNVEIAKNTDGDETYTVEFI